MSQEELDSYKYMEIDELFEELKKKLQSALDVCEENDKVDDSVINDLEYDVTNIDVIFKKMDYLYAKKKESHTKRKGGKDL